MAAILLLCLISLQIGQHGTQSQRPGNSQLPPTPMSMFIPTRSTTPEPCVDKLHNCDAFPQVCSKDSFEWSYWYCRRHCGLCRYVPTTEVKTTSLPIPSGESQTASPGQKISTIPTTATTLVTTTLEPCVDETSNCNYYGSGVCRSHPVWALENCKRYCDFCDRGTCSDRISNCMDYGRSVCEDQVYRQWVLQNCPKYCDMCGIDLDKHCTDTNSHCSTLDQAVCTDSRSISWAEKNCAKSCGFCGTSTTSQTNPTTRRHSILSTPRVSSTAFPLSTSTETPCRDEIPNCSSYGSTACRGIHSIWALENCQRYCGLCNRDWCQDKVNCAGYNSATCFPANAYDEYYVITNCAKTCQRCSEYCADSTSLCSALDKEVCHDNRTREWARENCPLTCGFCTMPTQPPQIVPPSPTAPTGSKSTLTPPVRTSISTTTFSHQLPVCENKISNCGAFGSRACRDHFDWALENCRQYCGYCAQCKLPNNRILQEGEEYQEGCQRRCRCVEGCTGRYICESVCPSINMNDIPSNCYLSGGTGNCGCSDTVFCQNGTALVIGQPGVNIGHRYSVLSNYTTIFLPAEYKGTKKTICDK